MASVIIFLILFNNFYFMSAIAKETNTTSTDIQSSTNSTASNNNRRLFKDEFYVKAHSYITKSTFFRNVSLLEIPNFIDELASWEVPKELEKSFPYYLAGYNDDNLPIWIGNGKTGDYNVREIAEKGEKALEVLEKYMQKGLLNVLLSMWRNGTQDVSEIVVIVDCDKVDMKQATHIPTIKYLVKMAKRYALIAYTVVQKAFLINATYAANVLIDIHKPILGQLLEKVSIYGVNKSKWMPMLLREFSKDVLPPKYGGSKSFKPISTFG